MKLITDHYKKISNLHDENVCHPTEPIPNFMRTLIISVITIFYSCSNANNAHKNEQSHPSKPKDLNELSRSDDPCFCADPNYILEGCDYEQYRLSPSDFKNVSLFPQDDLDGEGKEINADDYFILESVTKEAFLTAAKTKITAYDKNVDPEKYKINGTLDFGCRILKDTIDPNDEYSQTYTSAGEVSENSWVLIRESYYESTIYMLINTQTCDTIGTFETIPLIHPNGKDMFSFEYSYYEPNITSIYRFQIINQDLILTKYCLNFKKDIHFSNEFISTDGWIYFIDEIHYRKTGPVCDICDYYRIKFKQ
jgi:hypothetical protein